MYVSFCFLEYKIEIYQGLLSLIYTQTIHAFFFHIAYKSEKIAVSEITDFLFSWEKEQIVNKNIKN